MTRLLTPIGAALVAAASLALRLWGRREWKLLKGDRNA